MATLSKCFLYACASYSDIWISFSLSLENNARKNGAGREHENRLLSPREEHTPCRAHGAEIMSYHVENSASVAANYEREKVSTRRNRKSCAPLHFHHCGIHAQPHLNAFSPISRAARLMCSGTASFSSCEGPCSILGLVFSNARKHMIEEKGVSLDVRTHHSRTYAKKARTRAAHL